MWDPCFSILTHHRGMSNYYWSAIALHGIEWQPQFISSYWVSANNNWYLAHSSQRHLSAIRSWLTGWQFGCLSKGEKCKFCLWICSHTWCEGKGSVLPSSSKFSLYNQLLALPTCSHSTLFCPYFLLVIMWIIKVQVHETHINHLQWARNEPGLSHCSQHKLRPKHSQCKLSKSLPAAEFILTCLSLRAHHLQVSLTSKHPLLPNRHHNHRRFGFHLTQRWMLHKQMTCYLFWKPHLLHLAMLAAGLSVCSVLTFFKAQAALSRGY